MKSSPARIASVGVLAGGLSASYIKRMKERGYADLSLDEYIRLRNRGERE